MKPGAACSPGSIPLVANSIATFIPLAPFGDDAVTYVCNAGLVLSGDAMLSCVAPDVWSGTVPTCDPPGGPAPAPVASTEEIVATTEAPIATTEAVTTIEPIETTDSPTTVTLIETTTAEETIQPETTEYIETTTEIETTEHVTTEAAAMTTRKETTQPGTTTEYVETTTAYLDTTTDVETTMEHVETTTEYPETTTIYIAETTDSATTEAATSVELETSPEPTTIEAIAETTQQSTTEHLEASSEGQVESTAIQSTVQDLTADVSTTGDISISSPPPVRFLLTTFSTDGQTDLASTQETAPTTDRKSVLFLNLD